MVQESFLSSTKTVSSNKISFGQVKFNIEKENNLNFLSIFEIDKSLILLAIFSFIMTLIILLKMIKASNTPQSSKMTFESKFYLIIRNLFETDNSLIRYLNTVAMIVLFYNLYFMIFKFIITLNIKSSTVILNTSSIIDNHNDLLNTNYLICWLKDENVQTIGKEFLKFRVFF